MSRELLAMRVDLSVDVLSTELTLFFSLTACLDSLYGGTASFFSNSGPITLFFITCGPQQKIINNRFCRASNSPWLGGQRVTVTSSWIFFPLEEVEAALELPPSKLMYKPPNAFSLIPGSMRVEKSLLKQSDTDFSPGINTNMPLEGIRSGFWLDCD